MPIFDIAVNAANKQLVTHLDEIAKRSIEAGVDKWLMVAGDIEQAEQTLVLAEQLASNDDLSALQTYCTAGVHPHDAKSVSDDFIEQLRVLQQHPKVVAVGECGLDFNRDFSPRPVQELVFEQQLALACELQKPVYMHERDAAERFLAITSQYVDKLSKGVVHCFTGEKQTLKNYLDSGFYIGITGWVCDERRGLGLRELIEYIPRDRLMIETDAPFLLPRTLKPKPKSRRNEPCYLPHVAQSIAQILQQDLGVLETDCYRNSCEFFGALAVVCCDNQ